MSTTDVSMNPYQIWLFRTNSGSYQQLYKRIEIIAKYMMGLDEVPFSLSDLEHPPENIQCGEVNSFILQCLKVVAGDKSDAEAIKLIKFLKDNHPRESFENPKMPNREATKDEKQLMQHIFEFGIDLPGSKYNPFGHLQYYSSFFIDMFFGNYTEFHDHIERLSKDELQKDIKKREGYCQYSPVFAPILGLKLVALEFNTFFTCKQKQDIRKMYSGNNENKHLEILKKLIEFGADVNAQDINGYTPLHYALLPDCYKDLAFNTATVLLKHGANPNLESRDGSKILTNFSIQFNAAKMEFIDILIQHDAKLTEKKHANDLRTSVETYGSKELAVKVREAHPRGKEECEKCLKPAPRKCGACGLVYYCTPACQKLDWKFHKVSCKRN